MFSTEYVFKMELTLSDKSYITVRKFIPQNTSTVNDDNK